MATYNDVFYATKNRQVAVSRSSERAAVLSASVMQAVLALPSTPPPFFLFNLRERALYINGRYDASCSIRTGVVA